MLQNFLDISAKNNVISFLIKTILYLLILFVIVGFARTWMVEGKENQKIFLKGTVPNPLPDDLYKGSIGREVSWIGKKFNSANSTGINLFKDGSESYPFKTFVGQGARDKGISVLKIDYNILQNPFWIRFILDEIVEIKPGEYLGKLELCIIPGHPFALGFFTLKK